ncbi:MAG: hypothetical protein HUJ65_05170, partial [Oscillospiraceae bacterium]|nr:hypothetical protein [Oscillospiraceae bacterium]
TVSGGSKVKATGVHENGIYADGDIIITDKDTDVYAEGGMYGYYYNGVYSYSGSITVKDGAAVEAKGEWNGISTTGDVTVSGGSKVKATGVHANGIYADGDVTITGKNTDVYAKGGTYGYYEDQEYVEWMYDGIWSTTGITISDGAAVEAVGDWSGLETNGDVTVSGDGTKVTASGWLGISAYNADDTDNENRNVTVTGGKIEVTGTESAIRGILVTELEVKEGETKETAEVSDVDYSGSGTTTESKYITVGISEPACHAVKTVSPKDGTLQMYSGETYMGEYTFARKGSGWTICGEDGLYLTVSNGKLVYSETPMAWTYRNGAFSYTESTRGSYRNSSCKTYYLTASGVSTRSARITLKEEVSYDAHDLTVKASKDGTHTFTCKNCGYSYSEDCDFSDWTK